MLRMAVARCTNSSQILHEECASGSMFGQNNLCQGLVARGSIMYVVVQECPAMLQVAPVATVLSLRLGGQRMQKSCDVHLVS
mmetsp:Transcript_44251/g.71136  ORF Transcript_44251/g.71136 Transcript_44251/m.71136 type:complete len:82 (-) Transcript_44251:604-849(-)